MTYRHHVCTDRCRYLQVDEAHRRAWSKHRAMVRAKFHSGRPRLRWVS